jgi:hypothetical protein
MLSKMEIEFLKSPQDFGPNYRRVLRHRVNSKAQRIRQEIALLERCGFSVTENCNGVTEFCNGQQRSDQAVLPERWWAGPDLTPYGSESNSSVPFTKLFDRSMKRQLC